MDHGGSGVRTAQQDGGGDGTVIDLHVTAAGAAGAELVAAGVDGAAVLGRAGVADGLPFLLGGLPRVFRTSIY